MQTILLTKRGLLVILSMILLLVAVFGYTRVLDTSKSAIQSTGTVSGEVVYRERIALPAGSTIIVELQEISAFDQSTAIVAEKIFQTQGENVPIPFTISYDTSVINELSDYVLSARIQNGETVSFIATERYPVITKGNRIAGVVVMVNRPEEVIPDAITPPVSEFTNLVGMDFVWQYTEGGTTIDMGSPIAPTGNQFVLRFSADKRFTSSTDCNQLSGNYVQDGEVLSIGSVATTFMACVGEDILEEVYREQLSRVTSFLLTDSNQLRLNLVRDSGVMVFEQRSVTSDADEIMCTMDAMECSDGSFVGREGPNCAFAACPAE